MDPIALYYPNIHVGDETWLKYAALYWPKMGRLRPDGFQTYESHTSFKLLEANWLIDITPPEWATSEVAQPFLELLNSHAEPLRGRFGLNRIAHWNGPRVDDLGYSNIARTFYERADVDRMALLGRLDERLGYVHVSKVDHMLVSASVDAGLAITFPSKNGTWVGMHPELASAYVCALTDRIATEDQLHPLTDQLLPHSALSGWTLEHLVEALLEQPLKARTESHSDVRDAFVFMAFETVVPANLDKLPVEKVLEIRSEFGAELDAFRRYIAEQVERLAGLDDIRDLSVFQEYLRLEVERTINTQVAQLRERLHGVGQESIRALVNVKSVAVPPLAAAAASAIALSPTVIGGAALAACVLSAPAQWRRRRRTAIRESPVGYLFRIEKALKPASLIDRLRQSWMG